VDDVDSDNALDGSIFGIGYDYTYVKKDDTDPLIRNLEPENTFVVYDDTIEQNELFGVYYYRSKDDTTGMSKYKAVIATANYLYTLDITNNTKLSQSVTEEPEEHYFGEIPINCFKNNKYDIGDFEQQISLIDAYNTLMSDRINDKEQFIDALLVLYGAVLGDSEESTEDARKNLIELGLLELPSDAKADYLVKTLDESSVETLRKAIKEDIYTFSHVPNLTDENFVGNSSGVAMEYKLLGLEMITKIKERYYRNGLKKRIRMFCNYLGLSNILVDAEAIIPVFSRALPKNIVELAQVVANLKSSVSQETLLQLLPFVEDPADEVEKVKQEALNNAKIQREAFGGNPNDPPDFTKKEEGEVDDEE